MVAWIVVGGIMLGLLVGCGECVGSPECRRQHQRDHEFIRELEKKNDVQKTQTREELPRVFAARG